MVLYISWVIFLYNLVSGRVKKLSGFINLERTIKQDCSVTLSFFPHLGRGTYSLGSLLSFSSSTKLALQEWPHALWGHDYPTKHATGRWDSLGHVHQPDLLYSLRSHFLCLGPSFLLLELSPVCDILGGTSFNSTDTKVGKHWKYFSLTKVWGRMGEIKTLSSC